MVRLSDLLADADLTLSPANLPEGADNGRYPIADGWSRVRGTEGKVVVWRRDCPVYVARKKNMAPPSGMRLLRGEQELDYAYSAYKGRRSGWVVDDYEIYVASKESPKEWSEPPTLVHETSSAIEARMNYEASGLAAAEFVQFQATIDDETRSGLLLPAPSSATFEVTLPEQPRLQFATAIAPGPYLEVKARAELSISVDGDEIWSSIQSLGGGWTDQSLDLTRWAGKTVELTLESQPKGDNLRDYVMFAAPRIVGAPSPVGPRRIVVIGLDTTRPDHIGIHGHERSTSPGMDRFAAQSVVFDNVWAPAPRTRPSFRSSTTGRWPLQAITAETFGEVVKRAGFNTGGVVANIHLTPKMGFADGFDYWFFENSAAADDQVDRALAWLRHNEHTDSFLFVHFMDPHLHYNAPRPYANRFVDEGEQGDLPDRFNRWLIYRQMQRDKLTEEQKIWIEERYDGEVAYLDAQLLRLFTELDRLPGRTMVIVHSDHGEEFWEHGAYEHNHSLYDELVRAILWVRPPGGLIDGPHRVSQPVSLVDIAPTIYDIVGAHPQHELDGTSLRPYLDAALEDDVPALSEALDARPLPIGHLMFDKERWAVVYDGHKYILHTMSGEEELYDLEADPAESKNLVEKDGIDLDVFREKLGEATGWPVGPGWRIRLSKLRGPITLELAGPPVAAGVIDPEAGLRKRANLEWGEVPDKLPEDVARVSVDDNRVHIEPGPEATGTIYVLGPTGFEGASVVSVDPPVQLRAGTVKAGQDSLLVQPGTLIVVQDTEAQALAEEQDQDAIDALRALGYVE